MTRSTNVEFDIFIYSFMQNMEELFHLPKSCLGEWGYK